MSQWVLSWCWGGLKICLGTRYYSNLDEWFTVFHVLFIFLGKYVTEVEDFKLVCLAKQLLKTALATLDNLRGDKIKISDE